MALAFPAAAASRACQVTPAQRRPKQPLRTPAALRIMSLSAPVSPELERVHRRAPSPPAIDCAGFLAPQKQAFAPPQDVAGQIREATSEFGCFQLVNHGVSTELIASMQQEMRRFFALPKEAKLKIKRTQENPNGYFDDERTKQILDLKEGFDFCHEVLKPGATVVTSPNQWPAREPAFKSVMEAYLAEMSRVSFRLLEAFSVGMGLPRDTLHPLFQDDHTSFMRLNHYPAQPAGQQGLGLNHHTDAGFLTILVQDLEVHGLQFLYGGDWRDVPPVANALTINVGDQCQVITNDFFKASLHRVVAPRAKDRYSAPFFFNPRPEAVIAPTAAFVTPDRPAHYYPIPWETFREQRYAGDYSDVGEEIQISHYKRT